MISSVWVTSHVFSSQPWSMIHHVLTRRFKCHLLQTLCHYWFIAYTEWYVLWCACVRVLSDTQSLSRLCRQEKTEGCQPARIQLLLAYWYSGHTEPSRVSVARAKEECGKWRDSESHSLLYCADLKIDRILSSFLFPVHLGFHTQLLSLFLLLSYHPYFLVSLFGLRKYSSWCPEIRLLKSNGRQFEN